MRDWVARNYKERILALWHDEDDTVSGVEIVAQRPFRTEENLLLRDSVVEGLERSERHVV